MSNLTKRILSALVLIPFVLALVFFASKLIFIVAVAVIAALAGFEFGTMTLSSGHRAHRVLVALLAGAVSLSVSLFMEEPRLLLSVLALSCVLLFVFFMFSRPGFDRSVSAFGFSLAGVVYCGVLVGFMGLTFHTHTTFGPIWILLLLLGTFLGDTGAYAFGRLFGKRKLAPRLSPGKTWAGALGGFCCTTLAVGGIRYAFFPEMGWLFLLALSVCLSVFCQVGDLAESFLKRGIGVKDSGHLIPGHGGMLDRIDALMFGAPVVFLFSMLH